MKKTIKSLCDFLTVNRDFADSQKEKERTALLENSPKIALLSCPYALRFLSDISSVYAVGSYGGAVKGNEATLDYALLTMGIPVLVVLGHEDCSAIKGALKEEGKSHTEKELFSAIAPAFEEGKARRFRDNIMKHIDYQVSHALERYRLAVKSENLMVVGVFSDQEGRFYICNYNGLRGKECLSQALPDVSGDLFL